MYSVKIVCNFHLPGAFRDPTKIYRIDTVLVERIQICLPFSHQSSSKIIPHIVPYFFRSDVKLNARVHLTCMWHLPILERLYIVSDLDFSVFCSFDNWDCFWVGLFDFLKIKFYFYLVSFNTLYDVREFVYCYSNCEGIVLIIITGGCCWNQCIQHVTMVEEVWEIGDRF